MPRPAIGGTLPPVIQRTLFVVGPGGIGKSPLDHAFAPSVRRIDPYRLRAAGPRDRHDLFYGHPNLRADIDRAYGALGLAAVRLADEVEWFPEVATFRFKVRNDWQLLFLGGLDAALAKAELHALVLPVLLAHPPARALFGDVEVVVLHPGSRPAGATTDPDELEARTRDNCTRRGDTEVSVAERVGSIRRELAIWQDLVAAGAAECLDWPCPEYRYRPPGRSGSDLVRHQAVLLREARAALLAARARLAPFLRTEAEIDALDRPI